MYGFPALPDWDGVHPVVVHFPVALLTAVPVLLLVSLFARRTWRTWVWSAFTLMVLGTLAAWIAVGSGHAAGQLVDKTGTVAGALAVHEALGVLTRNLFVALTLVFAVFVLVPGRLRRPLPDGVRIAMHAVLLLVIAGATMVLANTSRQGMRLVHTEGVQAMIEPAVATPAAAPAATPRR